MSRHFEIKKDSDLTIYNQAENPMISIWSNGKVDITNDIEDKNKISLEKWTIVRFIDTWLNQCGHELFKEEIEQMEIRLNKIKNK